MTMRRKSDNNNSSYNLNCSFCGKSQREVKKLIAGPTVFICDECVDICLDIIAEDRLLEQQQETSLPKPKEIKEEGKITWELKRIPSTEIGYATFELFGMDEDEYDETELFVSGINPTSVVGAEPLPGDWDLKMKAPTVEEITVEEEPEDELDYDEVEEELDDESEGIDRPGGEASQAG